MLVKSVANNTSNIIVEYCSIMYSTSLAFPCKKYLNIFEPSSGGKGNKLNTPKDTLISAA